MPYIGGWLRLFNNKGMTLSLTILSLPIDESGASSSFVKPLRNCIFWASSFSQSVSMNRNHFRCKSLKNSDERKVWILHLWFGDWCNILARVPDNSFGTSLYHLNGKADFNYCWWFHVVVHRGHCSIDIKGRLFVPITSNATKPSEKISLSKPHLPGLPSVISGAQ